MKAIRSTSVRLAGLVLPLLVSSAAFASIEGVTESEIRLGMVNVQSGPASALGKGMRAGAEAVFKEINAKGGIHGRKINLVIGDDGYEPNRTIDETLKMIEEQKVFSLFGYVGTPTGNAVVPIVKESKVPLVGLFTGAMSFRAPVTREIVNVRASYDNEADALVSHFLAKGAKTVAVFHQDDGFGQAVLSGTEKALKKRGMDVAAKSSFQRNTLAVKAGLAAMLAAKPDAIVMVGPYAPLAAFIKEARAAGLKSQLATVSFVGTDALVDAVGKDGDGVVISQVVPFPQDLSMPVTKECADLVKRHAGENLGFVNFEGCITAKAMASALERAGKTLSRDSLLSAFEGFRQVDIGGFALSLSADSHQASDKVYMTQIADGKITALR